ncbi:conjugal transfer protein TraF [Grimontia sp. NTOU-MAR1]|uniref:conjugal transfer protein TraF n=1 Tax=Grimontia sp. NTOU-MAR1 TaxID=3111011 RepID=UPI002DBF4530|nr:conjugal transfer protein TraF [Grimontia sp. NTOU-MAR1]WRW00070.1 conjugal transfer protein TraF [Grimontia sp. NTOU-MAR1]
MKKSLLALSIALMSMPALAANYSIDSRIDAMGGAGTAASDYLSAGFHNPALVAMKPTSSFGVLFPVVGLQVRDPDELVDSLEDFGEIYDAFTANPTDPVNQTATANALSNVQNKLAYLNGGIGGAITIPTSTVSGTFFVKGYTEAIVMPEIEQSDIDAINNGVVPATLGSKGRVLAFGVVDVGLALASDLELAGQRIAIGITPKSQQYYTYHYEVNVDNFEGDDWDSDANRTEESAFNVDLGAAWQTGPFRLGFAAKNLISHEINTVPVSGIHSRVYTYHIEPLYTVGGAFVTDLFVAAIDVDLNEQKRFSAQGGPAIVDNTQLVRLGAEFNAWGWAQMRAGYINDLEDTLDGTVTLGLGLSPFNTVNFDLAAQLIDSNSYGGSVQLAFTF